MHFWWLCFFTLFFQMFAVSIIYVSIIYIIYIISIIYLSIICYISDMRLLFVVSLVLVHLWNRGYAFYTFLPNVCSIYSSSYSSWGIFRIVFKCYISDMRLLFVVSLVLVHLWNLGYAVTYAFRKFHTSFYYTVHRFSSEVP